MFVAFLPFPTAVLGEHNGSPPAAVLYGAAVALAGAASAGYWWYASGRGRLLRPDVGRARIRALRARGLSGPVLFALTLPIAVSLLMLRKYCGSSYSRLPGSCMSGSRPSKANSLV